MIYILLRKVVLTCWHHKEPDALWPDNLAGSPPQAHKVYDDPDTHSPFPIPYGHVPLTQSLV